MYFLRLSVVMKDLIFICCVVMMANCTPEKEVFMFSYFKGNGEDGLHLAHSEDGLHWEALNNDKSFLTPTIGKDKLMRDPCMLYGPDKKFHMVWTVSWGEKGIGYANSEDLVNWSEQQYIPVMEHEPDARNCWAPEIAYDKDSKQYMIYWSTTIPGRFPETDTTGDGGYNHRMYYVTTKDFKKFSETKLFYDQGFNVIDGTVIKERDKYLMIIKDETRYPPEKNLRLAKGKSFTGPYGKPGPPITGDYWAEGPSIVKHDGQWIVYFDKYRKKSMGAVVTKDWKEWDDISEKLSFPEGTRHGTVLKVPERILQNIKKSTGTI